MYGVVELQGHQYKVRPGDIIDVELMNNEVGSTIDLKEILFIGSETPLVGTPVVEGALAKAKVIRHGKGKKILVVKRRPRKWMKKNGHRQHFSALLITSLSDGQGHEETIDLESPKAKKYLAPAAEEKVEKQGEK